MAYASRMMRGKNIWLVPLLLALLVASVGWWADRQLHQTINRELRADLSATLDANVTALEIWMTNQKRIAASLADEPRLKAVALKLLDQPTEGFTNRAALNELSRELITGERLQERVRALGYGMVHLVNTNLTVISDAGRRRSRQGNKVPEELQPKYTELFTSGGAIIITPFKLKPPQIPQRGGNRPNRTNNEARPPREMFNPRPDFGTNNPAPSFDGPPPPLNEPPPTRDLTVMQVAAPIKNSTGETRGALALIINPDAEFTRILGVARSGDSGETFAFDAAGTLISESRFDEELKRVGLLTDETNAVSALTLSLRDPGGDLTQGFIANTNTTQPLILMVERAIEGEAGVEIEPFRDYRGVNVVGAWRWLPKHGFGVGTKIDAREAFESLRVVRRVFLILFLLLILAALVVLVFTYRQVIWRRRLTEAELKARQLGQYKLIEKIGEGGMGIVYKAHHSLLRRETALKLLPPEKADKASLERFEREVQLTCRLTHPNTIQVYDYGHTPDGIFYYAMEYLDGLNLHELVHRYGAQPEARVAHILKHICESLAEAHSLGLIHRDVKPANIFITDRGGVPDSVKVLDFGLVKHLASAPDSVQRIEVAGEDGIVGTPNFIAPETIRDPNQCDARSDLYSVGVLGYFLLTGREIFDGPTIAELCRKHLNETPVPPSQRLGKPLDARFESLLLRCLEKDPAARPRSATELAQQLTACNLTQNWTTDQRADWWIAHRKSLTGVQKPKPLGSSHIDKTVKIEFAERTP
jgi:serine/threonine protein kinase